MPNKIHSVMRSRSYVAVMLVMFVYSPLAEARQVRVVTSNVEDRRSTSGHFVGLGIELKVVGDLLKEAKAVRLVVERAIDETGKDLVDAEKSKSGFEQIRSAGENNMQLSLALKNPARQATVVREVSGYIEIFVPAKGAQSNITVANFMAGTGKPVTDATLKQAGIELTVWTKAQYEARKKAEEERLRKEREEKRKKGGNEPFEELGEAVAETMIGIFGKMFGGGFEEMGEFGVAIQINDPNGKLMDIAFEDAQGKPIKHKGMSTLGLSLSDLRKGQRTASYEFTDKLPDTARLKLALLTPEAIVKEPFKLTNIALP